MGGGHEYRKAEGGDSWKAADKCEGLRIERSFSSRHQAWNTKERSILIINHKDLCSEAWRRGWGCSFSQLCLFASSSENWLLTLLKLSAGVKLVGAGAECCVMMCLQCTDQAGAAVSSARVPLQRAFQISLMQITVVFSFSAKGRGV